MQWWRRHVCKQCHTQGHARHTGAGVWHGLLARRGKNPEPYRWTLSACELAVRDSRMTSTQLGQPPATGPHGTIAEAKSRDTSAPAGDSGERVKCMVTRLGSKHCHAFIDRRDAGRAAYGPP